VREDGNKVGKENNQENFWKIEEERKIIHK
jgi:hypothetical protein